MCVFVYMCAYSHLAFGNLNNIINITFLFLNMRNCSIHSFFLLQIYSNGTTGEFPYSIMLHYHSSFASFDFYDTHCPDFSPHFGCYFSNSFARLSSSESHYMFEFLRAHSFSTLSAKIFTFIPTAPIATSTQVTQI